ncbi:MAG TPA: hypothetical protein VIO60_05990 [Rectinemataceae bacterium]
MLKKALPLVLASLALILLFGACDLFMKIDIDDILGEWDFADATVKGAPASGLHVSVMDGDTSDPDMMVDVHFERNGGAVTYHAACDGTLEGRKFVGTYSAWSQDGQVDTDQSITITFSYKDGKLSIECKGSGGLDGVVMKDGELAEL